MRRRLSDDYCHPFDLSSCIPDSVVQAALQEGKLRFLKVTCSTEQLSTTEVLRSISIDLTSQEDGNTPIRYCVPSLGSPFWGHLSSQVIKSLVFTPYLRPDRGLRRTLHTSCILSGQACGSIQRLVHL